MKSIDLYGFIITSLDLAAGVHMSVLISILGLDICEDTPYCGYLLYERIKWKSLAEIRDA